MAVASEALMRAIGTSGISGKYRKTIWIVFIRKRVLFIVASHHEPPTSEVIAAC